MSIPPELSAVPAPDTQTKDLIATQHLEDVLTANDDDMLNEKQRHLGNHQLDDAKAILNQAGESIEISPEENKRLLRRIDWWVCAPMCIVYCVQSLDKSSLGHAAIFDLQKLTHLVGSQYSWLSSCGYAAQLVVQPLSAYVLVVFPVKYWVMFNMISWSIVTICTAAAKNFTGLLICRILLGCFEATILPSFVLITQMWWTRREQSYRTIAYQISLSVASAFGSLMSYGIGEAVVQTTTSIYPYQGIFLYLGAISLGCAPLVWYLLPNSPTTAKFLRHGNDRLIALERVRENNTGTKTSKWKWPQFWEAMRDIKTWMWTAMFICVSCPSNGFGTFGGLITKGFGFDSFKTQLMQIPIGIIGIIELLAAIWVTNKIKNRYIVIVVLSLPPIGACCGLVYMSRSNIGGLMACYYVTHTYPCLQPLLYAWANLNASGTTKRVIVTAVLFIGQCAGNMVGPQVYFDYEAPYYRTGLYVDIGCWSVLVLLCVAMFFHLRRLNRRQAIRRRELGLPEDLKDISIMTIDEAAAYRAELSVVMREQGINRDIVFENAFDDMTDFENPCFMYVI